MRRILLAALALALLAPSAAAATEDVAWRLDQRLVSMSAVPGGFTFLSSRDSALGDDVLSGSFDQQAGRLDVRMATREPDRSEAVLSLSWTTLVEYRDADGDGRLGLADPVLQRIELARLPSTTSVAPILGGQSATATYTLPANGTDGPLPVPSERGSLRLAFTLVTTPTTVAGASLVPAQLGLSAEVRSFPYQAGDSRLALVSHVATSAPRLDHDVGGVAVTQGNLTFRLAWAEVATADGVAQPAPSTGTSEQADRATLVQSWPRGEQVEQDGGMTAQRWTDGAAALVDALPPGDWRFYTLGVAVVAVGLGVPSLRRLRES